MAEERNMIYATCLRCSRSNRQHGMGGIRGIQRMPLFKYSSPVSLVICKNTMGIDCLLKSPPVLQCSPLPHTYTSPPVPLSPCPPFPLSPCLIHTPQPQSPPTPLPRPHTYIHTCTYMHIHTCINNSMCVTILPGWPQMDIGRQIY